MRMESICHRQSCCRSCNQWYHCCILAKKRCIGAYGQKVFSTAAAPQMKRDTVNEGTLTCFACSAAAARQLLTSASLSAHLLRLACRSPRTASLSRSIACSSSAHLE